MTREDHALLSEMLARALELDPGARHSYLDRVCAGAPALRAELESLLSHDANAPTILDPASNGLREEAPPERIGPFHVLGTLGEGGMGVVYLAEQRLPIRRQVAVKRIRSGLETRQVLARFEFERRNLATLEHPNIARVIDAGSTEDGRPYFAMEYVDGESILRYCDRRRLSIPDRIRLFLEVCEGVQHAHRHGIIHRDLKPSNLLIAEVEGRPLPKIIDFGIAKALESDRHDPAPVTVTGELLGTPEYMSPEQAASGGTVDTRTDVYALGSVLYELLVGCRPNGCPETGVPRWNRFDRDPPPPSASAASLGPDGETVAGARGGSIKGLIRQVRGDLDWIVMKSLERERDRRYGSVADLAGDLRKTLANEPVTARPPSFLYRTRKLARRHRTATALVAAIVPLGLAFAGTLVIQARRVAVERDRAERMLAFLTDVFDSEPPAVSGRWGGRTADDALTVGLDKIEENFDDPLSRARLYAIFGRTLRGVRSLEQAEAALVRARDGFASVLGSDHPETLSVQTELGRVHTWQGRLEDAERLLTGTLELQRRLLGDRHPDTIDTRFELAQATKLAGKHARASSLFEEVLDAMRVTRGERDPGTLVTKSLLASVYLDLRLLDDAEALLNEILERPDSLPAAERGMAVYNLACVRALRGDREAAMTNLRKAIYEHNFSIGFHVDPNLAPLFDDPEAQELAKRNRAMTHQRDALSSRALGDAAAGRYAEAETTLKALIRDTPPWNPDSASSAAWLLATSVYFPQGRYREAEPLLLESLEARRREQDPGPEPILGHLSLLAIARFGRGDHEGALAAIDEAIGLAGTSLGPNLHRSYLQGIRYALSGDRAAAVRRFDEAYRLGFWESPRLERDVDHLGLRGEAGLEPILAGVRDRYRYP